MQSIRVMSRCSPRKFILWLNSFIRIVTIMGISYIAFSAGATSSRIWFAGLLIRLGIVRFDDSFYTYPAFEVWFHTFCFWNFIFSWTITPSSFGASVLRSSRETLSWSYKVSRVFMSLTKYVNDLILFKILLQLNAFVLLGYCFCRIYHNFILSFSIKTIIFLIII